MCAQPIGGVSPIYIFAEANEKRQDWFQYVTVASWNVKGLGHAIRRGKVFKHLKSCAAYLIFLQETHIKASEQLRLRYHWISQVYQSLLTSEAHGVAIQGDPQHQIQIRHLAYQP